MQTEVRLTAYYAGSMVIPAMKRFCRQSGKAKYKAERMENK